MDLADGGLPGFAGSRVAERVVQAASDAELQGVHLDPTLMILLGCAARNLRNLYINCHLLSLLVVKGFGEIACAFKLNSFDAHFTALQDARRNA
jgi:hypothetical protein